MSNVKNLVGQRFGRLVVIERFGVSTAGQATWSCGCDCGATKVVASGALRSGSTRSCGCLSAERKAERVAVYRMKHGHYVGSVPSPTMSTWKAMWNRCTNSHASNFPYYGGRGIIVCDRWRSFEAFLADMGERPIGKTLDRFPNPDGNYEPSNCRWANRKEQRANRRTEDLTSSSW
jgi:hypothetical protein